MTDQAPSKSRILWVDDTLCLNCQPCLAQQTCNVKAIVRIDREDPPYIDIHRCHGCRICMAECPGGAIILR